MLGYLSADIICSDIICSEKLRGTDYVQGQISEHISPQMEAIVFLILQIFVATRAVLKIGEYLTIRLRAQVLYEQIVNEAQPSWLSLVEKEGE